MLRGKGFKEVYNLSGGIRSWKKPVAVGPPEQGLELFSDQQGIEETVIIGFGLEQGLREFYLNMKARVQEPEAAQLFHTLADIEIRHQEQLLDLYQQETGKTASIEDFVAHTVQPAMEGGLSTEEYLLLYKPNLDSTADILALALSIEAQALDLYQRAASQADGRPAAGVLQKIADEERAHMVRLTVLMDSQL